MDKDSTKPTFFQLFKAINDKSFLKLVRTSKTDKYTKKLTTEKLITLVALAQLDQAEGLRAISSSLHNEELNKSINLDSISHSQLSRKLRDTSPDLIQSLFREIVRRVGTEIGVSRVNEELQRLYLIDSSTISMCLSLYSWAKFRKTKSGVKLHLRLVLCDQEVYPDKAIITPAKPADKTQMDNLVVVEKDALNVFDRGYLDYKKFDNYCATGIRFVSRLKHNALVE
nr:IS4 family transposase [Desulfitobacterium hafniense]